MPIKKGAKPNKTEEFAVIATGGKQYKVSVGESVRIEKLQGEHQVGGKVSFDKVLLVDNGQDTTIGTPYISGAKVEAEIEKIGRLPKVTVIHYKQKSRYYKKAGHRQDFFQVKITALK
ncbi:MAG: 50S ribosomal protein L21 [Candidatus Paceibacterota bacterium]|jgi:large subunit ribosomal protein L21